MWRKDLIAKNCYNTELQTELQEREAYKMEITWQQLTRLITEERLIEGTCAQWDEHKAATKNVLITIPGPTCFKTGSLCI